MSEIQTFVHKIESGIGRVWMWRVALFAVLVGTSMIFFAHEFNGFAQPEAMECAQLGRNIARGKGYNTQVLRPISLHQIYIQRGGKYDYKQVTDTTQMPVYPYLLGVIYKITGTKFDIEAKKLADEVYYRPEVVTVTFGLMCTVATALLIFWLAHKMFDQRVAWVTVFVVAWCDLLWEFGISGLSTSFLILLATVVLCGLHQLMEADESGNVRGVWMWAGISACAMAIAVMTRATTVGLLAPFLIVLLVTSKRGPILAIFTAVVVLLPLFIWATRNQHLAGNPFASNISWLLSSGNDTDVTQGERMFYSGRETGWWKALPGLFKSKIISGAGYCMSNGFTLMGSNAVILFFVVGLMHRFRRRRARWLRIFMLSSVLVLGLCTVVFKVRPAAIDPWNNFILLWPGMALFGSAFFFVLLDRMEISSRYIRFGIGLLFLAVCSNSLYFTLNAGKARFPYPPYFSPLIKSAADFMDEKEIMMSDMPWATAWYGDRYTILVTKDFKEFSKISDTLGSPSGLLLTPLSINKPLMEIEHGENKDWSSMIRRIEIPKEMPLSVFVGLPTPGIGNRDEYLFFTDKQRW